MDPRDIALTEHTAPPANGLPYDGLEEIWALFPQARPGARLTDLQAAAPVHAAAGLPTDEAYMARVYDLVRREEALNFLRAQYERAALNPAAVYQQVMAPAPAPALPPAQPAAPQRAVPAFVWKYSAIALSTGGGIALAGVGVGAAAPTLALVPAILTATGQAVMSLTGLFVLIFLALAVRGSSRGSGGGGTTVNIRKAVFRRNKFHG
ncbi:hypothetical protein [Streptomyces chartreusis]|uniref:Uncharacterized protein n=1 Tax=Streptomyces chartreusis TaxID=1969 RepID=A0A7H8T535_STRCX|nr:hypothetical protein [Streptomyces chartreusis]QKZ18616.1 hypothetical protein HUT05_15295 [Streptomyces chartreusis]